MSPPTTSPAEAPGTRKARVLIIDDHAILREGLARLINQEADMVVCGQAEEAPKGFAAVAALKPDVALVDISLKGGNGLELIKNLKASYPKLPILVLSMHDECLYAERTLRAGGLGYLTKEEAAESVLVAIRRVLQGEVVLSQRMQTRLLRQMIGAGNRPSALGTGQSPTCQLPLVLLPILTAATVT